MSANNGSTGSASNVAQEGQFRVATTIKEENDGDDEVEIVAQQQRDLQMRLQRSRSLVYCPNPTLLRWKTNQKAQAYWTWTVEAEVLKKRPLYQQLPIMSDEKFQKKFRLSREHVFQELAQEFKEFMDMKIQNAIYRPAVCYIKRILIALYYLTASCTAKRAAYEFEVDEKTVNLALNEFLNLVTKTLYYRKTISFRDVGEMNRIANEFNSMWRFPNTFGALCATHFPIAPVTSPLVSPNDYLNSEGYHSYALISFVDAKGKFYCTRLDIKGSEDIEYVYKSSVIKKSIENGNFKASNLHVVSKDICEMTDTIMKPYEPKSSMSPQKEHFNKRLLSAAFVGENAFDRMRGRFKVLMKRPDLNMEMFAKAVKTCIVLHNMCEERGEKYWPSWNEAVSKHHKLFPQPLQINYLVEGNKRVLIDKRDALCESLYYDNVNFESA